MNRGLLMKRLQNYGINGIFMRNIMAMYSKTEYSIKLKGGYTRAINSNLGLKQGCPLTPMLFNLYIDDIKDIFDEQCEPINIHNSQINHFLYADDLVMLSASRTGLQKCIDNVFNFAKAKQLTISVKKSKTMVFNITDGRCSSRCLIEQADMVLRSNEETGYVSGMVLRERLFRAGLMLIT